MMDLMMMSKLAMILSLGSLGLGIISVVLAAVYGSAFKLRAAQLSSTILTLTREILRIKDQVEKNKVAAMQLFVGIDKVMDVKSLSKEQREQVQGAMEEEQKKYEGAKEMSFSDLAKKINNVEKELSDGLKKEIQEKKAQGRKIQEGVQKRKVKTTEKAV